jgi:beta-glucosidase
MTEHSGLVNGVLKGEWGFDGIMVSDWTAARDTVRAALGGLDVAMPGPDTVFGPALAQAVREGRVPESTVDEAVRRVLRLAARVGLLEGAPPAVDPTALPAPVDRDAAAHQVAVGSFVLLRNEGVLPLTADVGSVAVIGIAATRPSILGGGSARVVPKHAVSPLDGLVAAGLPVTYVPGADPYAMLAPAGEGFELRAVFRARDDDGGGDVLGELPLSDGDVHWYGSLPAGVDPARLTTVEVVGTFTPATSGQHVFGVLGNGFYRLTVDGRELVSGGEVADPLGYRVDRRAEIELEAHTTVPVSLTHTVPKITGVPAGTLVFTLGHKGPRPEADALVEEAVAVAAASDVAIVVVATTEEVESEGADRSSLGLPGRQDELVARVAAASRRTVVVVNAGSPVEMPWANDVAAILLTWFPGQEAGAALADVVTGAAEPGGRLPTTWPVRLIDCPVWNVTPTDGVLRYDEDVLIGYRAWQRSDTAPAFWFGHGLSYTTWSYEYAEPAGDSVTVRVRNTGDRPGREVIQVYVAPAEANPERPTRWLAGFASVQCGPGESAEVSVPVSPQAMRIWDDGWRALPGPYRVEVGRSSADIRLMKEVGQGIQ